MSDAAVKDEPSMEEILASIRKIISEQDTDTSKPATKPVTASAPAAAEGDVLELTRVVEDDGSITDLRSPAMPIIDEPPVAQQPAPPQVAEPEPNQLPVEDSSINDSLEEIASALDDDQDDDNESSVPDFTTAHDDDDDALDSDAIFAEELPDSDDTPFEDNAGEEAAFDEPAAEEETDSLLSQQATAASLSSLSALNEAIHNATKVSASAGTTLEDVTKDLLRPLLKQWMNDNLPDLIDRIVREEIQRLVDKKLKK